MICVDVIYLAALAQMLTKFTRFSAVYMRGYNLCKAEKLQLTSGWY